MTNDNTGGPAFPCDNSTYNQGLTMRDYFAAKAMALVNMNNHSSLCREPAEDYRARRAYAQADAMLKARG